MQISNNFKPPPSDFCGVYSMIQFNSIFRDLLKNRAVVLSCDVAPAFVAFCRAAGYFVLSIPSEDGANVVIYR